MYFSYTRERTQIVVNGTIAAQSSFDYGTEYFSTDLLGSVKSATDLYGTAEASYTYDVFGSLVQGVLAGSTDLGYLGKQKDSVGPKSIK